MCDYQEKYNRTEKLWWTEKIKDQAEMKKLAWKNT